jgi:hypothetical protein
VPARQGDHKGLPLHFEKIRPPLKMKSSECNRFVTINSDEMCYSG